MMKSRLKIAELSDVHLGHHKTHAKHIIENLNKSLELDLITKQTKNNQIIC